MMKKLRGFLPIGLISLFVVVSVYIAIPSAYSEFREIKYPPSETSERNDAQPIVSEKNTFMIDELDNKSDTTNIAKLIPSDALPDAWAFRGVIILDNYAYVTSRDGGYLLVYKLDDLLESDTYLGEVTELNSIKIDGSATTIARKDNYLYVGGSCISIIDVSTRENPQLLGTIYYNSYRSIKVVDDYLIALGSSGSYLFDISTTPTDPLYLNSFGGNHNNVDATIFNDYLYVAEWIDTQGIRIYDISDINDIQELNFISLDDDPYHVDVMNGYLFSVADVYPDYNSYLYSHSLSNPGNPVLLDSLDLSVSGRAFGITNAFCVIAGSGYGNVIDITNPSSMNIIGDIYDQGGTGDGFPFDVAIYDNLILIAGQNYVLASKIDIELSPNLKLPLPGGKHWLLTVEAGGKTLWGGIDKFHTGKGHYSLDFDDITKEDGKLTDVEILAAGNGKVIQSGEQRGYGFTVVIDHDEPYDGTGYTTRYAHLKETPSVSNGDDVSQGQFLGTMGNTGWSKGSHLHFQVYFNRSSASSVVELQGLIIDGLAIDDYKVGTIRPRNLIYYLSTQ